MSRRSWPNNGPTRATRTRVSALASATWVGEVPLPHPGGAVGRPRCCSRGKGIARPEQPREPKQSWRAQAKPAWMWAIPPAPRVCWTAHSEQPPSESCVGKERIQGRCDLDHPAVAWSGGAVISSPATHTLLQLAFRALAPGAESAATASWGKQERQVSVLLVAQGGSVADR